MDMREYAKRLGLTNVKTINYYGESGRGYEALCGTLRTGHFASAYESGLVRLLDVQGGKEGIRHPHLAKVKSKILSTLNQAIYIVQERDSGQCLSGNHRMVGTYEQIRDGQLSSTEAFTNVIILPSTVTTQDRLGVQAGSNETNLPSWRSQFVWTAPTKAAALVRDVATILSIPAINEHGDKKLPIRKPRATDLAMRIVATLYDDEYGGQLLAHGKVSSKTFGASPLHLAKNHAIRESRSTAYACGLPPCIVRSDDRDDILATLSDLLEPFVAIMSEYKKIKCLHKGEMVNILKPSGVQYTILAACLRGEIALDYSAGPVCVETVLAALKMHGSTIMEKNGGFSSSATEVGHHFWTLIKDLDTDTAKNLKKKTTRKKPKESGLRLAANIRRK